MGELQGCIVPPGKNDLQSMKMCVGAFHPLLDADGLMAICAKRLAELMDPNDYNDDLLEITEVHEYLDYHDCEKFREAQRKADQDKTSHQSFAREYGEERRRMRGTDDVARKGKGKSKGAKGDDGGDPPGDLRIPFEIMSHQVKRYMPPGTQILPSRPQALWRAYIAPYKRIHEDIRTGGEQTSLRRLFRRS